MKNFIIKHKSDHITTFIATDKQGGLFYKMERPDKTISTILYIGKIDALKETKRGWSFETLMLTGKIVKLSFPRPDWEKVEID